MVGCLHGTIRGSSFKVFVGLYAACYGERVSGSPQNIFSLNEEKRYEEDHRRKQITFNKLVLMR